MASAQVLPNSMASTRKLEHLEAGKRRLEEFRRKKAAERDRKAAPPSQHHISDGGSHEKKPLESEHAQRITDSDGATTANRAGRSITESFLAVVKDDRRADGFSQNIEQDSLNERHSNYSFTRNGDGAFSADPVKQPSNYQEIKTFNGLRLSGPTDVNSRHEILETNLDSGAPSVSQARFSFGSASGTTPQTIEETDGIFSQSAHHGVDGLHYGRDSQDNSTVMSSGLLHKFSANMSPQNSVGNLQHTGPNNNNILASEHAFSSSYDGLFNSKTRTGYSSHEVGENVHRTFGFIDSQTPDLVQRKPFDATDFTGVKAANALSSESAGLNTDRRSPSNYETPYTGSSENSYRRSRPSFLDSITIPRAPSGTFLGHAEHDKVSDGFEAVEKDSRVSFSFQNPKKSDGFKTDEHFGTELFPKPFMDMKTVGTASDFASQNTPASYDNSFPSSVFSVKGVDQSSIGIEDNTMERKHELYSSKQNEDFAALEQHIEDLTQEKFSLQRALEASRTLGESLAAENSSLTNSYNQQRSVVNQLKSDMEMLREAMKAQMVELESIKLEYANAQLECNAADERAKLIASEVIGLEEKALRLRSNELRLERQLENLEAEISSYKKRMSSMEKERQDFQSTIDALQEEKKLLQSKLRKASTSGKSIDINSISNRKEMSTSTEDLDTTPGSSNHEVKDASSHTEDDTSGAPMLLDDATTEVSSVIFPPDHMRMIHNINALIAELAVEKEELTQALTSELASSSRLKELNKELSRKLEAQTQRLELLTAQSMAGEIVPVKQRDPHTLHDDEIILADEGDEVVERVLGWIMKLFPGGPSRRRTSKLL